MVMFDLLFCSSCSGAQRRAKVVRKGKPCPGITIPHRRMRGQGGTLPGGRLPTSLRGSTKALHKGHDSVTGRGYACGERQLHPTGGRWNRDVRVVQGMATFPARCRCVGVSGGVSGKCAPRLCSRRCGVVRRAGPLAVFRNVRKRVRRGVRGGRRHALTCGEGSGPIRRLAPPQVKTCSHVFTS